MGIISEYKITDNSEYLLSGGKTIQQVEKYTLEIEIKERVLKLKGGYE